MNELFALLFCLGRQKKYFNFQNEFLEFLKLNPRRSFLQTKEVIHILNAEILNEIFTKREFNDLLDCKVHCQYVVYGDEDYPPEFYFLTDPPLIFSYLGSPCWRDSYKITVVGSRNPTEKSLHWMSLELKKMIIQSDWVTVSGGAIGVDQWVHHMSINSRKKTIAILPSGLGAMYPSSIKKIASIIIENGGCLISEFYPFEEMRKFHFKYRNRLIAALNQICLVIEAKEKSGSLITGNFILEMGKKLFVLPGHPLDSNFKGSHDLIKLGGSVITCYQDFYDFI